MLQVDPNLIPSGAPSFIHLRVHTEYSVSDSTVRIDQLVARAKEDRMGALAITDSSNLFGMVKFYKAARGAGVKPIVGADCWVANDTDRDKPSRILLLVRTHAGYLKLCDVLTRAWLENPHRGRAELSRDWLAQGCEGLIALSAAQAGDVGQALAAGNLAAAERAARFWSAAFPGSFYVELQRADAPGTEGYINAALALAAKLDLPVVATHPVQFLDQSDFQAHEARVCIAEGYTLSDTRRPRRFTESSYCKTQTEMGELFADIPEALANSVEIAKRCNLKLELGRPKLPLFPTPDGISLEDYLVAQAKEGLAKRLVHLYPDAAARAAAEPTYMERLLFETATIIKMGFPGYFLIVADFINWAKQNNIPVGPGRGSGAGSLVAYALGITDLDPLKYDLLFERFLNPERVSMPDFDIDFCQSGRDRVIEYVRQKYGAQSVSQIATFGTMAAKAVVRDVGRVMDWGYGRTDELAKLIPFQPGKLITLEMAREMEPRLAEREETDEETRELLALAEQLEGLTRNVGMHAGGVLIAPSKLTDFCPLYAAQGSESPVSQLDKDDVEAIGLVKFDFLGLTTLTILDWTLRYVKRLDPDSTVTLEALPLDDKKTFKIFQDANTAAIFQFESRGMRDLLKRARPDRLEDLIALNALYRPGPMDLIPTYIDRKHGREQVTYLDRRLEPLIGPTYGIMVYQEQVMQIAQQIGGYSLGSADLLRRAMGKKKPEEMAQQRDIFSAGAEKNGLARDKASELFDLMEKFAGYGFNKSHSAAYALVAYQTAYFKAHYPAAFMAANMSLVMDDTDKVQQLYLDSKDNGLTILPPDVNQSAYRFEPVDTTTIRYGLGGVKGTGQGAIELIIEAREERPFEDIFDFALRTDKRLVNRRVVEALVRAGAFDALNPDRARLLASVPIAMEAAEQAERDAGQGSLFGGGGVDEIGVRNPELVKAAPWDERTRLTEEKLALGFFVSGHPFNVVKREVSGFVRGTLATLVPRSEPTLLAGIVASARMQQTRRGRMAIIVLDDGTAQIEVMVFAELYEQHRELLREDQPLVLQGKVQSDEFSGGIRISANEVFSLADARAKFGRQLRLSMNGEADSKRLMELLKPFRGGGLAVRVCYHKNGAESVLRLSDDWKVRPEDGLMDQLSAWLTPANVEVLYA
jgi:DNA polymerase III subunit alpha